MEKALTPSPLHFGFHYNSHTNQVGATELPYPGERHVLLFGLNGAGKSTRIIVQNLVTLRNRSMVIFDVKGELAAMTARARRHYGDVKILNPFHVLDLPSDGFNPLARLNPDTPTFFDEAAALAEAMVEVESKDPHWAESARGLLLAFLMWEVMTATQEHRTPSLFNVRCMLTEADTYEKYTDAEGKPRQRLVKGFSYTVAQMITHGGDTIASLAGRFSREEGRGELASIQSTAITQTEYLLSTAMRRDLETTGGVDFSQLRQRPTTVYVILPPDEITRMRRWTRMVMTSALRALFQPGAVKTLFVLDEYYAALGHLKIVENVWSLVRGYGIQLMPVIQSATQLKTLYGENWENFAAQAGAVITIGPPGDLLTAKWMSERSGVTSAWEESFSTGEQNNMQGMGMSHGASARQTTAPFLLPQDFLDMKPGRGRMWLPGEGSRSFPFFAPHYWRRSDLRQLVDPNPYHAASAGAGDAPVSAPMRHVTATSSPPFDLADYLGTLIVGAFVVGILVFLFTFKSPPKSSVSSPRTSAPVGQAVSPGAQPRRATSQR